MTDGAAPRHYYNEIDEYAAQWLRNQIDEGLIAPGVVDTRSIVDVQPDDLEGFTQCHFFAGLGGWPFALRLAGWPDSRRVWTGSCPCQPFSVAGSQHGFADKRHLWPEFQRLIAKQRPPVVFGEQVASAAQWLRLVRGDLEAMDYAVGAMPIEAASAGADHFRDRYWFVADHDEQCASEEWQQRSREFGGSGSTAEDHLEVVADSVREGSHAGAHAGVHSREESARAWDVDPAGYCRSSLVDLARLGWGEGWTEHEFRGRGFTAAVASIDGCQYVECTEGKQPVWRRLPPPRVRWLGNGIPARVAKLRALGNAIDPRPAVQMIRAYMDCRPRP